MKSIFGAGSLSLHMISGLVVVVILTAITVGVPAILLLQNQLEFQAGSQVEQGQRTVLSLYDQQLLELQNLTILTAQRPTLQQLLEAGASTPLIDYLATLQRGAGVDLIAVCRSGAAFATTDPSVLICGQPDQDGFLILPQTTNPEIWMIARTSVSIATKTEDIIVGLRLDDSFAMEIQDQTGLEHALCLDGQAAASSFLAEGLPDGVSRSCAFEAGSSDLRFSVDIAGTPYSAAATPLTDQGLYAVTALDISEISQVQRRLVLWMTAAMFGVAAAGSALGILLARRISRPLENLSEAAATFSHGDLGSPLVTDTRVKEISLVATSLEKARIDLLKTLTSLESERDWSENLLASIVEGIVTLDKDHRITFFSRGAEQITGWTSQEVLGRSIDQILQLLDSEKPFSSVLPSVPGGRQKADVVLAEKRIASLAITSARLPQAVDRETEIALVFRDISEEEAVHRLLGHFIADVAHELRTPLTALEASIELLLDQGLALSKEEIAELYNSLHLGIIGLHTLVDNLLESANIEARRFRISPRSSDLGAIIAEAVQTLQPLLSKYGQRINVMLPGDLPVVKADPRRTVQVLVNLISNAIRYGPPGEEINIQVTTSPREARLEVIDRGPGIPTEHRDNLFRRFEFPHDDQAISQAGAGLGLSVVKAIVQAHGGKVGIDDRPGGGSIFWFTLPIAGEEA